MRAIDVSRRWVQRSARWPVYTQLLVAGGLVIAASVAISMLRGDGGTGGTIAVVTSTPAATSTQPTPASTQPTPASSVAQADTTSVLVTSETSTIAASSTTSADTTSPPTAPPSVRPAPTTIATTTTPPSSGGRSALEVLRTIPVEAEHGDGYSRDLFVVWADLDGDGCDTRQEVLRAESLDLVQADPSGCPILAGRWYSIYDGLTFEDPSELDIDHVVALKEAWDSGAWAWTSVQRIAYANDMSDPRTLVAVSASSNRSKGDRDPSNWLPPVEDPCRYVADWVAVKARWSLSMDQSEWGRIKNLLQGSCQGTTID